MQVDLYSYKTGIDLPQPNLNVNPKPNNTKTGVTSNPVEKKNCGCLSPDDVKVKVGDDCSLSNNVKVKVNDDTITIRLNLLQGLQGPAGNQGKTGLSFYEEAVANGLFTGTYEEFLTKYIPGLVANNVDPTTIHATMTWTNSNW